MKASSLLLALFLFILVVPAHAQKTQKQVLVNLNTFRESPVDGCADYYFLSKSDEKNNKYICVHDFAQLAYFKINGKLQKLVYKPGKDISDALFTNKEYDLNIKSFPKSQPVRRVIE